MHRKSAIILAAGRGERLKPLTNKIPKPLVCIQGVPLIDYHLTRLAKAGFERVYINHAYRGGLIRQYVGNGQRYNLEVIYLPEPPGALETGGALFELSKLIACENILAINGDIYCDYPFDTMPPPTFKKIHLVLVDTPSDSLKSDFGLTKQGYVINKPADFVFSGIAWYHHKALEGLCPGRYSITPLIRHLADEGQVTGEHYQGLWCDVGTPHRLAALETFLSQP